jgi:hypothetical protein
VRIASPGKRSKPVAHNAHSIPVTETVTDSENFAWDPFGTLHKALWIGGAQWAGKSTVSNILADRHNLTAYHYDYHDARAHTDRRIAQHVRNGGQSRELFDPEDWVRRTPAELAADCLDGSFPVRLPYVFDDLRALTGPRPILAEGIGLRPDALAPLLDAPDRMIVMVPTEEFRQHQLRALPRAGTLTHNVTDRDKAQANRVTRDRLLADDAVRKAREHGIRVLEVTGHRNAEAIADEVASHFTRYLC